MRHSLAAAELEGEGEALPVPTGLQTSDGEDQGPLPDINFDDGEYSSILVIITAPFICRGSLESS